MRDCCYVIGLMRYVFMYIVHHVGKSKYKYIDIYIYVFTKYKGRRKYS